MPAANRKAILFVPFDYASLREHLILANQIKKDALYDVVFLLYRPQVITDAVKANLESIGFNYVDVYTSKKPELGVSEVGQVMFPRLDVLKDLIALWIKALRIRIQARRLLNRLNVYCLVLCGDRIPGWETALVRAANAKKRASIIIQYAVYGSSGVAAYNYLRKSNGGYPYRVSNSSINKLTNKIVPNISRTHLGEDVLIWKYVMSLAYYFSGLMPKNPWVQGGGYAQTMLVEGEKVLKYYLTEGMESGKMIVTGKPSSDTLYHGYLKYRDNQIGNSGDADNLRVLLAVPQMGEHKTFEWEEHLKEIDFMFECLTRDKKVELILSLHPKMRKEDYIDFAVKYDCKFATGNIYEEIPRCDLFVSICSSTLTSALALGKKGVAILYVYYYGDGAGVFDSAVNLAMVYQKQDLPHVISEAIREVRDTAAESNEFDPEWSIVDGKSVARIVGHIYREIEKSLHIRSFT
jgi:hypothetical protein